MDEDRQKYLTMSDNDTLRDLQQRAVTLKGSSIKKTSDTKKLQKEIFITCFEKIGNLQISCDTAMICRKTYHNWLNQDEEFAERIEIAKEIFNDYLRSELHKRAVKGVFIPKLYKGKLVVVPAESLPFDISNTLPKTSEGDIVIGEHQASDKLFELLLKSRLPEFKIMGDDNTPPPNININMVNPTDPRSTIINHEADGNTEEE